MADRLTVDVAEHVATVTLNRPEKNNAIDIEMFDAFAGIGQRIAADRSIRAVVLTGAGEHFCAGIDLSAFQGEGLVTAGQGRMAPRDDSPANYFQTAAYVWHELPMPVIAAMHGVTYGGGMQIALGADIRYATPDARLSIMEIKWGIIPDMAITSTALQIVPLDRLKELAYSARVISGSEALGYGLVTAVKDDPLAAAQELAAEIAGRSPDAVRAIKQLFDRSWNTGVAESLALEASLQTGLMGTPNQVEAVMANLQKRAPDFGDV